ncbi:ATP-dependent DNA helicase [Roseateles oligotrophus]|uniref:ATP-dependent DNA helicase n=1 Tax=Roseateles oligotrophus TaxID=1769250 RepID=A0ABT2YID6_9BURK|nr:ATP-dependent DNA helicase [Roseateles oligotrophus]MCV2369824.1 ATP-dependent DNA helicase [Roseateles oligotrophus]
MKPYSVAVRALCEFTAKQGDLDLRFTPAPSAQEGIAGHALVAARRPAHYQAELALSAEFQGLLVRGRADGFDALLGRLEEVKTFKGRVEQIPENHRLLHWAQLKVYGAMLCQAQGLAELELALVYFNIGSQQETMLIERHAAVDLQAYFELLCGRFLVWAEQELAHRGARDSALSALAFPHGSFRPGQRDLAAGVYRAAQTGRCLMAQAPTGIGKTVGTIFPLLKACPTQQLDKIYFLAAKTAGRGLALEALSLLKNSVMALPLRVLELVARDKACEHPDKACHGESCPLARGFYDRLAAARAAAVSASIGKLLDRATLRELALAHEICPYYLSQELVRWSDVVVGDYNYYFDVSALLHGLMQANQWRVAVLVDEAHNLVERGRKMYSADLDQASLRAARLNAPAGLKKPLDRLHRQWNEMNKEQAEDYHVLGGLPLKFLAAVQLLNAAISEHLADHPTEVNATLQTFYFEALHFVRMAELFGTHSLCDLSQSSKASASLARANSVLCLRNVLPAPFLGPRFAASRTTVLFSATLQPMQYFSDILGLPPDTARLEVAAPFAAEQLRVSVAGQISTRYQQRRASLPAIVDLMARQFEAQPGNYLAFFSSHDYLQEAAALFEAQCPEITVWKQARRMAEQEQQAFLDRLTPDSQGIGFVVLGGSFGEAVDLPGKRLIGAFIATLGLPQVNAVNQQIKLRLDQLMGGAGYDYTYLYPGLQKVVQAAGRVIRSSSDCGVLHLMDDRYGRREVQALLPSWWCLSHCQQ